MKKWRLLVGLSALLTIPGTLFGYNDFVFGVGDDDAGCGLVPCWGAQFTFTVRAYNWATQMEEQQTFTVGDCGPWSVNNIYWNPPLTPVGPMTITGMDGWYFVRWGTDQYGRLVAHFSCHNPHSQLYTKSCDDKRGGDQCKTCRPPAMARYSAHTMLASLNIEDTPIGYAPPRGPAMNFTVTYNQRDIPSSETLDYSSLGPNWTFNWLSYVTDDPNNGSTNSVVYVSGGGAEVYSGFDPGSQSYLPDPQSHAVLSRTQTDPIKYERTLPDGSKQVYAQSDHSSSVTRRIFMTEMWDAAGNKATIDFHDATSLMIDSITDDLGYKITLSYDSNNPFRIIGVSEPIQFGSRSASFNYDSSGRLNTITDEIGIQSRFTYKPGTNFIDTLTTPYGTTMFATGESGTNKWIEMTDPLHGKERVEYRDGAPGINGSEPVAPEGMTNSSLDIANTFYWDKKAYAYYPDYTKARIIHWVYNSDGSVSGIAASEKAPLENRVWYAYSGQSNTNYAGSIGSPSKIARILDDDTTQAKYFEYDSLGNLTKYTDPENRVTSYVYDPNKIDLRGIFQRNPNGESPDPYQEGAIADKIMEYGDYVLHRPGFMIDASGQRTDYEYNASGQLTSVQNARREATIYAYSDGTIQDVPEGYLASIRSPDFAGQFAVTSFTYDYANRIHTVTSSPDNYTVTTVYDALDRPTLITYSDTPQTTQEFEYMQDFEHGNGLEPILDLTRSKDRQGRWTTRHYDGNRRMDWIKDPLDRMTSFDWCTCGSLVGITDPNGNVTHFEHDLQSRVISKTFAYGTPEAQTVLYIYENTTSRLKSMIDALSPPQTTNYEYWIDDNLKQVTYTGAHHPTPNVAYDYDDFYNRIKNVTSSGSGVINGTIGYTYHAVTTAGNLGANKVETITGIFGSSDTVTYLYDELGRQVSQSIGNVAASMHYDSLGRMDTSTNPLGTFPREYETVTPRLHALNYPNGQTANYSYFGNTNDRRLQTLQNLTSGSANLSQFDYTYDPEGEILSWTKVLDSTASGLWFTYDDAQQLAVARNNANSNIATYENAFVYNLAGNRVHDSVSNPQIPIPNGVAHSSTPNVLNQLIDRTLIVNGVPVESQPITYDLNGNMTANYDANQQYEWDAANRLVAINYIDTGDRTEFAYDGLGRRVKITEYGPAVTAEVQPKDASYVGFGTAEFNLPTGAYELKFEGLNPNGGNNTALIDSVTLDALVPGGDFEAPEVEEDTVAPADSGWNYLDSAGIASANGELMHDGHPAPSGNQAAFITNTGTLWQYGTVTPLTYTLNFQAAQFFGNDSAQTLRVMLRGATSTKTFVWSGNTIAEERDASGENVTKRFYAEGEQRIGGKDEGLYYYSRDHLGSIREVTNENGELVAQYDYDAWGNRVTLTGNPNFDLGFTGHYFHQSSGLNLTMYRAYSPTLGRWISRDPLTNAERSEGPNLYWYVQNDPLSKIDKSGLWPEIPGTDGKEVNCMGFALGVNGCLGLSAPSTHGCRLVDCRTPCDKCKEYKILILDDPFDPEKAHVYREKYGGGYITKYGKGGIGIGPNPLVDYIDFFDPKGRPTVTCYCCPRGE